MLVAISLVLTGLSMLFCPQLIDRQVELRAGLDAAAADRLLWFGGNTVKILPFLVSNGDGRFDVHESSRLLSDVCICNLWVPMPSTH